jgi:hypothetical protein
MLEDSINRFIVF